MRTQGSILLATADPVLDAELAGLPGFQVRSPGCETPADCLEHAAALQQGTVILSPALAPWPGALVALTKEIRSRFPGLQVLVLLYPEHLAPEERQALRRAGVAALTIDERTAPSVAAWLNGTPMPNPPGPSTQATTQQAPAPRRPGLLSREPRQPEQTPQPPPAWQAPVQPQVLRQKTVAFWGGKPGTGRSTMVAAVADTISRIPGVRLCTVDLNPQNSTLATLLRRESDRNSWWRLSECLMTGPLTAQAVREALIPIQQGWSLLTGPAGSDQWCGLLTAQVVSELLDLLRADFDYILLDLPAGRSPVGDAALALAQQVILVVSAFFPDVTDTTRVLDLAVSDGILTRDRCSLVLSQWVDSAELPADDVSACLDLSVVAIVPLNPAGALQAARTGIPVTRLTSADTKVLGERLANVAGLVAEMGVLRPQRRSWFGR